MTLLSIDANAYRWNKGQYTLTVSVTVGRKYTKISAHWYPEKHKLPRFDVYHVMFRHPAV